MNFYKRGTISVQGTAVSQNSSDLTSSVRTEALRLLDLYASTVGALRRLRTDDKIERQIESTENGYVYTFTITDSCETTIWQ